MNLKQQIIKAAENRGAKNVKVNIGKTGVSLSINRKVRFTGHENLFSLSDAIEGHSDLSWMN